MSLSIYCVHSISGQSADSVFEYYTRTAKALTEYGYNVFHPMIGKNFLRTEMSFKAVDYRHPLTCNHSIFNRDRWMVLKADVIYANFLGTKIVSIGSMFELAWASFNNKLVIVTMEEDNIHRHAFVMEGASTIFTTEEETLDYLHKLSTKQY
jgi:hypothetical protein